MFSKWRQCSVQQAVVAYFEMPTIGLFYHVAKYFSTLKGIFVSSFLRISWEHQSHHPSLLY